MKALDLLALLPIIYLAAISVLLMLVIAIKRDYKLAWWIATSGLMLTLTAVPVAWQQVPTMVTQLIVIDDYALFFTTLLLITGGFVLVFSYDYFKDRPGENEELFLLILFALLGAITLVSSYHFASFFIGLETLSVSLFALIAYPINQRRSLEAAIKYFILSGVSSAFLLFGMALIYAELGTLSFAELPQLFTSFGNQPYSFVGIIMLITALGFKLSLVPFHMWTADVYQGAPAPITAFVATVSKAAVFAVMLRYFVSAKIFNFEQLYAVISTLAFATILAGNLLALLQTNVKRILAYSSIAHLGYLLVAFAASFYIELQLVIETAMFYLLAYIITTLGSFGIVSALSTSNSEAEMLEDYTGLFWSRPWIAAIFTVMLLSLAGIPLTAGFIGKFYVFSTGVYGQLWPLLFMVVIGSGIGLFYYLRIVLQMSKQIPEKNRLLADRLQAPSTSAHFALSILMLLVLWLGIFPDTLIDPLVSIAASISN
jgi:NADH-quinone oxidoreductase subunit N